ncbi:MAG: SPOR domain-containing protein [Bdellovibrionales bacterium]
MTHSPPPDNDEELFPQQPVRSEFTQVRVYRTRRVATIAVLAALIAAGGYAFYAFTRAPGEVPTIAAEGPYKQRPEQPGGIDIPNQDVLAYRQIENGGTPQSPQAEHLLPPPEMPQTQPAPQPEATGGDTVQPSAETAGSLEPPPPAQVPTTVSPEKKTAEATPAPSPSALPPVEPAEAPKSLEEPAPAAPVAAAPQPPPAPTAVKEITKEPSRTAAPAGGRKNSRVQLASYPDAGTAKKQSAAMQTKYSATLGSAKLHVMKADLGARGIYYRVQSSPISTSEAQDICSRLKKQKAGCIVVKP